MHGRGIAGALWSAVRRLALAPGGIRAPITAVTVAAIFAGPVPTANAAVEYTYTGGNFTTVSGVYTTSERVTGDVIFNAPLTSSHDNLFPPTQPLPFSFTFSDGVNTISSASPNVVTVGAASEFTTNAADQIVSANFGVGQNFGQNAANRGSAVILPFGVGSRADAINSPNGSGTAISAAGGAWSGPTPVVTSAPQIVYLDFGAGPATIQVNTTNPSGFIPATTYTKQDAGLTAAQINTVVSNVQATYSAYNVQFTATQPASGTTYDTIYVGGTPANELPISVQSKVGPKVLGLAANVNIGNSIGNDTAVVFSGLPVFTTTCLGGIIPCPNTSLLSQVIAHETGHILGLAHTNSTVSSPLYNNSNPPNPGLLPIPDLMSPVGDPSSTVITAGPVPRAEFNGSGIITKTDPLGFSYGMQNSDANLQCGVGFAGTGAKICSGVIGFTNTDFSLASTSDTIFRAKLLIEQPGSDSDVGAFAYALGTISPGFNDIIGLPLSPDDSFAVEGSLTAGGPDILFDTEAFGLDTSNPTLSSSGTPLNESAVPEPDSMLILITAIGLITWIKSSEKKQGEKL